MQGDEGSWEVPSSWWRHTVPFRGRGPERKVVVDEAAEVTVAELLATAEDALRRELADARSDVELARAGELYLGSPGGLLCRSHPEATPLGVAVVWASLGVAIDYRQHARLGALVDDVVAHRGIGFAAEAGVLMGSLRAYDPDKRYNYRGTDADRIVERAGAGDVASYRPVEPLLLRLRTLLAAADDGDYAEAVERAGRHRDGPIGVRIFASYLVPTEQGWLDEVVAEIRSWTFEHTDLASLVLSATTAEQATTLVDVAGDWAVCDLTGAIHSLAAHAGPASAPVLARVFDGEADADVRKRVLALLGQLPTDEAFGLMLDRVDQKSVQPVVFDAMGRFPRRAMRLLAEAASSSATVVSLLRAHCVAHRDLIEEVVPEVSPAAAQAIDKASSDTPAAPTAPDDQVPPILRTPPWADRKQRPKPVVIEGLHVASPVTLHWLPGEQENWAAADEQGGWVKVADWPKLFEQHVERDSWMALPVLAHAPEHLVRPYLRDYVPTSVYDAEGGLRRILGRFGDEAIALVVRAVRANTSQYAPVLLALEGTDVASQMADWFARSKSIRPVARRWFERHPEAAARDLVPVALGKPGKDRAAAESALRLLERQGHGGAVREAARQHGPEVLAAVEQALALDPLDLLPARIPTLPSWLDPVQLPQVLLPSREAALPGEAVRHICTMFAISKPGETYAGVDVVRDAVDPGSLAGLAWGLFERWRGAGYPAKEGWVLEALGLVGDDDTVRELAPLIRAWPGESAHKRAVAGLDVLSAIGSDVALMHLHGIAQKAKFRGLKTQAQAKMQEVADGLGLSSEQLADRLVPDFGLDPGGSLVLDYGSRRFRVGFDEHLKPTIADEDGARRKTLPKPGAKDDPTLAPAAYTRFGGLKKDVRTVAADQIRRFEHAMVTGRRWTASEQRALFIEHPLLWHLARRLVWATFAADGVPTGSFRVAEDRTLADAADDEITLPDETVVGIAHPLHLGDTVGAWSDLFADYEVLQPFTQLGREVYALGEAERSLRVLDRFSGRKVPTGKVLGLSSREWERGSPQDGGIQGVVFRQLGGGRTVVINLDPGIPAGEAMMWDEQTLAEVWLNDSPVEWGDSEGNLPFGELDPVSASEMLRDLEALVS